MTDLKWNIDSKRYLLDVEEGKIRARIIYRSGYRGKDEYVVIFEDEALQRKRATFLFITDAHKYAVKHVREYDRKLSENVSIWKRIEAKIWSWLERILEDRK